METLLRVGLGNAVAAGLLALAAALVGVFARGRPALRHGLWILVLLKLVTPPLWTVPVAWVAGPAAWLTQGPETLERVSDPGQVDLLPEPELSVVLGDVPELIDAVPASPAPAVGIAAASANLPWKGWVFLFWGTGSLLTLGLAAGRIRQFQRLLRVAEPAPEPLQRQVVTLARRLGLAQVPTTGLVPGVVSPLVWGLGRGACLIVPRELWDRLDDRQRDTLLTHELAHLRRRDHWVRCLELLVTGLYWWLPVVWIARHALREAEEQCCDAWVVWAFPDAARTYAEALLETLDFLSGAGPAAAVAASGLGPVHHLKRRMTMIMQGTTPRALTWSGLLAVLSFSATLLPLSLSWADQRPPVEEEFFNSLKKDHEFNDPRWPFLIKVKDVQDKTLVDATFKHRAGGAQDPNRFDMVVEARKATVEFDTNKGVAHVHLDGAEVTNPREDVALVDNQTLEIVFAGDRYVADDEENDEEALASTADEPEARDRGPRPKRDGDRPDAPEARDRGPRPKRDGDRPDAPRPRATREVRISRRDGGPPLERSEALQKALAELKEMASRREGTVLDERARGELERAIQRLQALVQKGHAEAQAHEGGRPHHDEHPQPAPRKPESDKRAKPDAPKEGPEAKERPSHTTPFRTHGDAPKEGPEAKERRAELEKLRAEVAERQKSLMEAQMRLSKAMRQMAGSGLFPEPPVRSERFEFRFAPPGPPDAGKMMRMLPRPDQDKRIAELEERLQKLQDEVKSLRKDSPEKE